MIGGRYRLERRVALGGMASVWEARDDVLARSVAVKILHPHLGADEQFVARFKREAVAAAKLAHQSIVAIYDTCSQEGLEAIVMELVRGTTLRAELDKRGRFPPVEAAHIVAEIADALACAHAAGIVHRDVKPANVLLSSDGRVLVADFGIAKAGDGLDLTGTDTTLGTAKYLAPEQVDGSIGAVDARADVYAAGVILYELLCGSPPFVADTEAATAFARLHRDPTRPREVVPDLDTAMESVVLRAMARDPAARLQSALELRDALHDAARGVAPADGPPTAAVAAVAPLAVDPTGIVPVDGTRVVPSPATAPPPVAPVPAAPRPRRRWAPYVLGTIVVVAVAVAGVLWLSTNDDGGGGADDGTDPPPAAEGGGLQVADVRSFDPEGDDGLENEEDAGNVVDGSASTTWRTSCYSSSAFGNLKSGVGLVVELSGEGSLGELRVDSAGVGWSADVYVAGEAGAELADWGAPVTSATSEGGTTSFDLGDAEGRFLLLWFTGLGDEPSPDCNDQPFGVSVSDLTVV
jgi:eukaryotic-like serine/threonine-protein kinase